MRPRAGRRRSALSVTASVSGQQVIGAGGNTGNSAGVRGKALLRWGWLNTGAGCLERLWSPSSGTFEAPLGTVLRCVTLPEQGLDQSVSRGACQPEPPWDCAT